MHRLKSKTLKIIILVVVIIVIIRICSTALHVLLDIHATLIRSRGR